MGELPVITGPLSAAAIKAENALADAQRKAKETPRGVQLAKLREMGMSALTPDTIKAALELETLQKGVLQSMWEQQGHGQDNPDIDFALRQASIRVNVLTTVLGLIQ